MNTRRALALVRRDLAPDELPDPPDNLDFLDLPEDFQDKVADRFSRGVALTAKRDSVTHQLWVDQVNGMRSRRERFSHAANEARRARIVRERANQASLGERSPALREAYRAAHRADNSGSGK